MAIEDIIWAKNRHMFGGIEPNEVQDFSARIIVKDNDTNIIRMMITLPDDTVVNGQTLCSVSGVIVRGSLDDYPKDELSGIDFGDYSENGEHDKEWDIDGRHTLYLSVFAYSDQGVVNRNAKHVTLKLISGMTYHFGYDLDTTNRDPDKRITYPEDVYNHGWIAADANGFNYWAAAMPFSPKPCIIDESGNVVTYLKEDDYTKDDIFGDDIQIDETKHLVMMEWPKIYTKRWEEDGVYHFRCSDLKVEEDYECWCNLDGNGNEIDHFYTAVYISSYTNGKLGSYSGSSIQRGIYSSMLDYATYSDRRSGWLMDRLVDNQLILDLLTMIFKTTDLISVLTSSPTGSVSLKTGVTDTYGSFSLAGESAEKPYSKVFGMEHFINVERWIQGVSAERDSVDFDNKGKYYAYVNGETYTTDKNLTSTSGAISKMQVYPWGRLPSELGGSTTLDYCSLTEWSSYAHPDSYKYAIGDRVYMFGYKTYWDSNSSPSSERQACRMSFKPYAK